MVYRVRQAQPPREAALKLLRSSVWRGSAVQRFETEVRALARLSDPGIAQVYEVGADPGDPVSASASVRVSNISEDQTPGRKVRDPGHPAADAEGYVTYSNVNAVEEMVNMISSSRSYQNNIEVMNTAKSLLLKTLQMGQV